MSSLGRPVLASSTISCSPRVQSGKLTLKFSWNQQDLLRDQLLWGELVNKFSIYISSFQWFWKRLSILQQIARLNLVSKRQNRIIARLCNHSIRRDSPPFLSQSENLTKMCFPACWTWDELICNYLQGHNQKIIHDCPWLNSFLRYFFITSPSKNKTTKKWLRQICLILVTVLLPILGSRDGAVVRALTSHQCGPDWTPEPSIILVSVCCWFSSFSKAFAPSSPVFLPPLTPTLQNSNSIWIP